MISYSTLGGTWSSVRIESPRPHVLNVGSETKFERFISHPEVKYAGALFDRGEQQLPKQYLSRRAPGQVDHEARLMPMVPAAIGVPEVKGDWTSVPIEAREPQPAGISGDPRQSLVKLALGLLVKQTRIRSHLPPGYVLFEELLEVRHD